MDNEQRRHEHGRDEERRTERAGTDARAKRALIVCECYRCRVLRCPAWTGGRRKERDRAASVARDQLQIEGRPPRASSSGSRSRCSPFTATASGQPAAWKPHRSGQRGSDGVRDPGYIGRLVPLLAPLCAPGQGSILSLGSCSHARKPREPRTRVGLTWLWTTTRPASAARQTAIWW